MSTSTRSPARRTSGTSSSWIVTGRAAQLDLLAVAHPLVGALAVDLDRRDGGRHLLDVADERRPAPRGPSPRRGRRSATVATTSPSASSVVVATPSRIGGVVRLLGQHQVAEQPGGPVDAEHQHAGGHRVEGAGVADLAGAGQPAHPRDDVVRGQPGRLVDDDQAGRRRSLRVVVVVESSSSSSCLARLPVRVGLAGVRRAARRAATSSSSAARLRQHLVEVPGVLGQRVGDERQRRRVPHAELLGDLGADQALGRLQRRGRAGQARPRSPSTV